MIRRIDYWIGTRLFHPPIVWLCQRTGMTQHAVSAYAWMAAAFTLVARIGHGELGFAIVATLLAVTSTISAAVVPDMRRRPSLYFRVFIWALVLIDIADRAAGDPTHRKWFVWALLWDVLGLTGEYAKTIKTIPPLQDRRRAPTEAGLIRKGESVP
jgi:hypothetical protein